MNKYLLYILLAVLLYFIIYYAFIKKSKYYIYFNKELGFGDLFLDKFTEAELRDSYDYIMNYSRKGIALTENVNAEFYARIKAINDKFHIFTNI